jgi:hypothetical protein
MFGTKPKVRIKAKPLYVAITTMQTIAKLKSARKDICAPFLVHGQHILACFQRFFHFFLFPSTSSLMESSEFFRLLQGISREQRAFEKKKETDF